MQFIDQTTWSDLHKLREVFHKSLRPPRRSHRRQWRFTLNAVMRRWSDYRRQASAPRSELKSSAAARPPSVRCAGERRPSSVDGDLELIILVRSRSTAAVTIICMSRAIGIPSPSQPDRPYLRMQLATSSVSPTQNDMVRQDHAHFLERARRRSEGAPSALASCPSHAATHAARRGRRWCRSPTTSSGAEPETATRTIPAGAAPRTVAFVSNLPSSSTSSAPGTRAANGATSSPVGAGLVHRLSLMQPWFARWPRIGCPRSRRADRQRRP